MLVYIKVGTRIEIALEADLSASSNQPCNMSESKLAKLPCAI